MSRPDEEALTDCAFCDLLPAHRRERLRYLRRASSARSRDDRTGQFFPNHRADVIWFFDSVSRNARDFESHV